MYRESRDKNCFKQITGPVLINKNLSLILQLNSKSDFVTVCKVGRLNIANILS